MVQKQQVEMESSEVERALEELRKASDADAVYRSAGNILLKAKKDDLVKELEEKKELSGTRSAVLTKQETRIRESIKELQAKIEDAIKGRAPSAQPSSS